MSDTFLFMWIGIVLLAIFLSALDLLLGIPVNVTANLLISGVCVAISEIASLKDKVNDRSDTSP